MAVGPDCLRDADAVDRTAVASAVDADCERKSARHTAAIVPDRLGGGLWPPLLCAAGAGLLHLRLPARLHHNPPAAVPDRSRHLRPGRRLGDGLNRPLQHDRLAQRWLAAEPSAAALYTV